jgi:hypothetical protein
MLHHVASNICQGLPRPQLPNRLPFNSSNEGSNALDDVAGDIWQVLPQSTSRRPTGSRVPAPTV